MQIFSRKNAHFRYFIYLLSFLHAITELNLLQCFGKRIENLVHLLLAHIERIADVFHYLFGFLLCFAFGGSSCFGGLLIFGYLAGKVSFLTFLPQPSYLFSRLMSYKRTNTFPSA